MGTYSWLVCGLAAFDLLVVALVFLVLLSHPFLDRKFRLIRAVALSGFVFHAVMFFDGAILYLQLTTLGGGSRLLNDCKHSVNRPVVRSAATARTLFPTRASGLMATL